MASSIVFIPGAIMANSSWPKYDCPAPAATMRLSYANSLTSPGRAVVCTTRRSRSNPVTLDSTTSTFLRLRSVWRSTGEMEPGDRMPVAT